MCDFYDKSENDHALRSVNIETRNDLPALAVQIVSAKHDLAAEKPEALVQAIHDEISRLQKAYETRREHGF